MSSTLHGLTQTEPTVFDVPVGGGSGDTPDAPSLAVAAMESRWELLNDLWGGTPTMRANKKWLTQEGDETDAAFEKRRNRSVCFGGWKETLQRLASAPFRRPVTIHGEDLPDWVGQLERNVNLAGRDLTQFAHEVLFSGWFYGHGVMLGEAPESAMVRGQGVGDSRNRAYLVDIPPSRIRGWKVEYDAAGNEVFTELRVLEYGTEPDGEFRERQVRRVRHYRQPLGGEAGSVTVYTSRDNGSEGSWVAEEPLPYTLEGPNGGLPVFPAYVNYVGPLQSEPPLEDLAWHNQMHWESQSDQRNILRFLRCATLVAENMDDNEVAQIVIGANRVIPARNATGNGRALYYVEHQGKGAEVGFQDLDRIEAMMERLGLSPLLRDSAKVTATGQHINAQGANSLLEQSVKALENALNDAFQWVATVRGEDLPDDFRISAMDQFDVPVMGGANKQEILLRSAQAGLLPVRVYLEALKKDGFIGAHVDIDEIEEQIEAQRERDMRELEPTPFGDE